MHNVKIVSIYFNGKVVKGEIQGHPNTALDKAHALSTAMFGPLVRWRFLSISYIPPTKNDLASNGYIIFEAGEISG